MLKIINFLSNYIANALIREFALFVLLMFYYTLPGLVIDGELKFRFSNFLFLLLNSFAIALFWVCIANWNKCFRTIIIIISSLMFSMEVFVYFHQHARISISTLLLCMQTNLSESCEFISSNESIKALQKTLFTIIVSLSSFFIFNKLYFKYLPPPIHIRTYKTTARYFLHYIRRKLKYITNIRVQKCRPNKLKVCRINYVSTLVIVLPLLSTMSIFSIYGLRYLGYEEKYCNAFIYRLYSLYALKLVSDGFNLQDFETIQRNCSAMSETNDSLTIVYVIGESHSRLHSSPYGYFLPTQPTIDRLSRDSSVIVLTDVVAWHNQTRVQWPRLLSLDLSDGSKFKTSPLIPTLFKKAGFYVSLFDNQTSIKSCKKFDFSTHYFIGSAGIQRLCFDNANNITFPYDTELINSYHIPDKKRTFTIYHLMGLHGEAYNRFPKSEAYFDTNDYACLKNFTQAEKQSVADYDNAALMTDQVLSKIINEIKDRISIMIYVPDHGDSMYDCTMTWGRHGDAILGDNMTKENRILNLEKIKTQYEIPCYIYFSKKYAKRYPTNINALKRNAAKPILNIDLGHTLLDIAGIRTPSFCSPASLLSDSVFREKRLLNPSQNICYDEIKPEVSALKTFYPLNPK